MVAPRVSNSVEDFILTIELSAFLCDWLGRKPKPSRSHRVAFRLYALNLALATGFTASGTLLHVVDPLPQEPTALWRVFVLTCVSTPILMPVVLACALHPRLSSTSWALCRAWLASSTACHALLLLTGADLSALGLSPPAMRLGGRTLDGRSIGGEPYGITFDLLTSVPATRGDGLFLHAGLFTLSAAACLCICALAARRAPAAAAAEGVPAHLAWRLVLALGIMLLGQVTMIPLLCMVGVPRTLDVWHASIFVVMGLAYSALRVLVCCPPTGKQL